MDRVTLINFSRVLFKDVGDDNYGFEVQNLNIKNKVQNPKFRKNPKN